MRYGCRAPFRASARLVVGYMLDDRVVRASGQVPSLRGRDRDRPNSTEPVSGFAGDRTRRCGLGSPKTAFRTTDDRRVRNASTTTTSQQNGALGDRGRDRLSATRSDSPRGGSNSDESPLTPYLVVDINPDGNSWPVYMTLLDGAFLCRAIHSETGQELGRSDGTPEGTFLVKHMNPIIEEEDGEIDYLAAVDGLLFFRADDGTHGDELWMSDGTEGGTLLVEDINPGPADGDVGDEDMMALGDTLFFYADDGIHGGELWALPLSLPVYLPLVIRGGT